MSPKPKTLTSPDELPLTEEQRDFLKSIISILQKVVNKFGDDGPTAYLLAGDKRIGLPHGNSSKEAFVTMVRMAARMTGAEMVITTASSWTIPPDKFDAYVKGRTPYKSMADHPDRMDIVSIIIETTKGYWIGQAPMEKKKMGKLSWMEAPLMKGNFTNFLSHPKPPKRKRRRNAPN